MITIEKRTAKDSLEIARDNINRVIENDIDEEGNIKDDSLADSTLIYQAKELLRLGNGDIWQNIESAKEELKEAFDEMKEEIGYHYIEDLNNSDIEERLTDRLEEIADSNTPIYYSDIDICYFLDSDKADEAFENAGLGLADADNKYKQTALYFLIEQELDQYLNDLIDNKA